MPDQKNLPDILHPRELTVAEYLDQVEGEIRGYGRSIVSGIVAIGRKLVEVKERLKEEVGHGHYEKFVRERLRFSKSAAHRFVQCYEWSKIPPVGLLAESLQIDARALYLLAQSSTTDEVRTAALEKARTEGISHAEVQKLMAAARAEEAIKAKEEAEKAAAAELSASEAAAKKAAEESGALSEQVRQSELKIAQAQQKIAELEATVTADTQEVREEVEAKYRGKLLWSEALGRARVDHLTASLNGQIEELQAQRDEAVAELERVRAEQAKAVTAAVERSAAEATAIKEPSPSPFNSDLSFKAMEAGVAIEHCRNQIKLSPDQCIAIEIEASTRFRNTPALAHEKLGRIAAAVHDLLPWFQQFLASYEREISQALPRNDAARAIVDFPLARLPEAERAPAPVQLDIEDLPGQE